MKLKRDLLDRLQPSEALEVVGALLDLYPNGRASAKPHIAGLAKILCEYPRQVARQASHPVLGVARDTKFIPVPADVIAWCDRETIPLQARYSAAQRAAEQIEQRDDGKASERMRALANAWLSGEDPKAKLLKGHSSEVEKLRAERSKELNRVEMDRRRAETVEEWTSAGLKPPTIGNVPISMELAAMCERWAEDREAHEAERKSA